MREHPTMKTFALAAALAILGVIGVFVVIIGASVS